MKGHLGSVRVVMDDSANVEETRDYYPFGLPMPGRYEKGSPPTKEDFTGHVKDEATGLHYAGARYYSAAFARWTTTEPLLRSKGAGQLLEDRPRILSVSPYDYTYGNPVSLLDPTGLAAEPPYTFFVRSFHPSREFGGFFHGDNRSFSTSTAVTSRIQQRVTLNTDTRNLSSGQTGSDPTSNKLLPGVSVPETPSGSFSGLSSERNSLGNDILSFSSSYSGSNPLVPGSPSIDVSSMFAVTENKELGLLTITADIEADGFPATEAFVADKSGNSVFIGAAAFEGTPLNLFGGADQDVINNTVQIKINDEGTFQGVIHNGEQYSPQEWNERFE
jgi:RHS repeat-associated protein